MASLLIILAVILILLIPVHICVKFDKKKFSGFARVLFFKYRFPKAKDKKETVSAAEDTTEKSGGSLETFKSLISPILKMLGKLIRMLSFNRILADIRLAGGDACQTAIMYGGACTGVSTILPFLENNLRIKRKSISVVADFESNESSIYLETDISIPIFKLIFLAVYFLIKYKKEREMA